MKYSDLCNAVQNEIAQVLGSIDESKLNEFVELLSRDGIKVMGYSAGRMGFGLKAFLMRLNHLGIPAYWLGDNYIPPMNENDVFICASNSGTTASVFNILEIFKNKAKGHIVSFVGNEESKMAVNSEIAIKFKTCNGGLNSADDDTKINSIQPMTTLTEQSMFVLFDVIAMMLIEKKHIDIKETKKYH